MVRAVVSGEARQGMHVGRVAVTASGYFTIQTNVGKVPDVAHWYRHLLQRTDGYTYRFGTRVSLPPPTEKGAPVSSPAYRQEVHRRIIHGEFRKTSPA